MRIVPAKTLVPGDHVISEFVFSTPDEAEAYMITLREMNQTQPTIFMVISVEHDIEIFVKNNPIFYSQVRLIDSTTGMMKRAVHRPNCFAMLV